jgi:hypothetical protein
MTYKKQMVDWNLTNTFLDNGLKSGLHETYTGTKDIKRDQKGANLLLCFHLWLAYSKVVTSSIELAFQNISFVLSSSCSCDQKRNQ